MYQFLKKLVWGRAIRKKIPKRCIECPFNYDKYVCRYYGCWIDIKNVVEDPKKDHYAYTKDTKPSYCKLKSFVGEE